ncbi:carbon-nitrogen hydrolase family protein [Naumannella sp. ID2617S]|nr:carbon-nitrogen hydrolase family protein [Naumannella sp. ID2617S]
MKVAIAQICSSREVADNLRLVAEQAQAAADQGAELVVFPEATMRAFGHNLTEIAEPIDGEFGQAVSRIAHDAGIAVLVGMFTPGHPSAGSGDKVRNTLLVAGPDGQRTSYDKIHLYDAFGFAESDTVDAGTEQVRISVGEATVGLSICYDVRFPQLYINHAREGAQVLVVSASWGAGDGKIEQWQLVTRARAVDATAFVLACGQADPAAARVDAKQGAPTGVGHSQVVSPLGQVIAEAGAAPELLVVDLDLGQVEQARRSLPVLANARLS